jgi:Holliday junction resolvase RusA-like endonuclease
MIEEYPIGAPLSPKKLIYSLFVDGEPKAQPRPRKGRYGNFYNPPTADAWREALQISFLMNRKPMIESRIVDLKINFFFHREGMSAEKVPHSGKPDIDNLIKPVMDALTAIGIWKDDCMVNTVEAKKYCTSGNSGAYICIEAEGEA